MPIDSSRVRAILFDIDGTLSDTDDQFVLRVSRWLQPIRFLLPKGDTLPLARKLVMKTETPGTMLMGIPDRLGLDGAVIALGDWLYQAGLGRSPRPFQLIPGVDHLLSRLVGRYALAIVSARRERIAARFLDQFHLSSLFQVVVSATSAAHTKPYPDPVLWAARQMQLPPHACLMVGDTTVDIQAGKAAGAQTVGVLCGFGEEQELRQAGADLILPTTTDLLNFL
jgi:phosphoglycolate phosphatase-like HAD superfamily hydrolase